MHIVHLRKVLHPWCNTSEHANQLKYLEFSVICLGIIKIDVNFICLEYTKYTNFSHPLSKGLTLMNMFISYLFTSIDIITFLSDYIYLYIRIIYESLFCSSLTYLIFFQPITNSFSEKWYVKKQIFIYFSLYKQNIQILCNTLSHIFVANFLLAIFKLYHKKHQLFFTSDCMK